MTNMFLENAYYIEETVRQASNKAPERIKVHTLHEWPENIKVIHTHKNIQPYYTSFYFILHLKVLRCIIYSKISCKNTELLLRYVLSHSSHVH